MEERLRIGILGCGDFSANFAPLFKAHPYVERVVAADILPERARAFGERFGVETFGSLEELLNTDINCVAIFVPRHLHGPIALECLNRGRNVYSAVPMASEIGQCEEIVRAVERTGLTYMMGETCVYYPCSMFCREKMEAGEMGRFVYAEAQYHHDISHFPQNFRDDPPSAGIPPFYYATHSTAMALAAAGSHAVKVTAMGYADTEDEPYYKTDVNLWANPFSNEFALLRLANGGVIRINECRRIGWRAPSSTLSAFYGTKGGYQFSNAQHVFTRLSGAGVTLEDVSGYVNPEAVTANRARPDFMEQVANHVWQWDSFAPVQRAERLPVEFRGLCNGHMASHQFLVDDFCQAACHHTLPPVHAWAAARYTIPGLAAHESAMRDGEPVDIPDCGDAPETW